jgi:hypothetical protein
MGIETAKSVIGLKRLTRRMNAGSNEMTIPAASWIKNPMDNRLKVSVKRSDGSDR